MGDPVVTGQLGEADTLSSAEADLPNLPLGEAGLSVPLSSGSSTFSHGVGHVLGASPEE